MPWTWNSSEPYSGALLAFCQMMEWRLCWWEEPASSSLEFINLNLLCMTRLPFPRDKDALDNLSCGSRRLLEMRGLHPVREFGLGS